ncbi:hypothetical protein [Arcobacter roscoffensis]|nr:hypothetical protein [Arcobacter roscoffensis]
MKMDYYDSCYSSGLSSMDILSQFKLQGMFIVGTILTSSFFVLVT